jgi:hypothetical protein
MNEIEDSNKTRKKMQNHETTLKYVGCDENKLQEIKNNGKKANFKS